MSGFSGFVWTEGAFVLKKSIQTQKYRDSYGRRLSQTQFLSWNRNYPKLGFSNNQWRIQGGPARSPPPPPTTIIFDQTEAPRAEFFFLEAGPLPAPLSQGQEDRASPLSEGLVWIYRALYDLRLMLLISSFPVYYCLVKLFITLCPCLCLLPLLMGL